MPVDEGRSNTVSSGQPFYGSGSDWMTPNSMGGAGSPFTIISSNPTYMSYRDPAPSAAPFTSFMSNYNGSSGEGSMQSFIPQQQAYQNFLTPDVVMTDFSMPPTPMDSARYTFSPSSNGNENVNLDELFTPQMGNGSTLSSYSVGTSPISHTSSIGKASPSSQSDASHHTCRK